MRFLVYT